jgi:pyruvate,water dikinase
MSEQLKPEWQVIIDLFRDTDPVLFNRLGKKMMHYLYKHNIEKIDSLMQKLESSDNEEMEQDKNNLNEPMPKMEQNMLEQIMEEIFTIASEELTSQDITTIIKLWLKDEKARFISMAAEKRDISLAEISDALHRYAKMSENSKHFSPEESIGIIVALIRRFLSEDLRFINVTKNYTTISDFTDIISKTIGPSRGNGKLGGKAAGLIRASKIILSKKATTPILKNLSIPKTWYLTSDGIIDFVHFNAMEELPNIKYRNPIEIKQEYAYLEQIFKNSSMPPEIVAGLNLALDDFGDQPLVVRSSSLLEDNFGASFAGKYKSLFVANIGTKKERLEALIDAILEVWASVFGPDPIEYRRERGLLDFDEEMAIVIQEVVGRKVGKYFFPAFAGVAFSSNEIRWSPRIKRTDGIVRLVGGLGTRAVDRVDNDYPLLISPGQPGLRVNINPEEIMLYSQRNIDLINLLSKRFETISFEKLIREVGYNYPSLNQILSIYRDGEMQTPTGNMLNLKEDMPVITFSRLLSSGTFVSQIKSILQILKEELSFEVDVEFACDGDINKLYLLQCRPQSQSEYVKNKEVPDNVPAVDQLFSADAFITTAQVEDIKYIVYVDPEEYDCLESMEELIHVGRVISEINQKLPRQKFILMGPGRWGSRGDIKLGIRIGYSDINNTAMLIEIAKKKKDYVPEVSFGTHFFQDLVEAKIRYLPLYPDKDGIIFNEIFFKKSYNSLLEIVPTANKLDHVVKVLDVAKIRNNSTLEIIMDGDQNKALAYFKK